MCVHERGGRDPQRVGKRRQWSSRTMKAERGTIWEGKQLGTEESRGLRDQLERNIMTYKYENSIIRGCRDG